jgi:hypothetical protein
MRLHPLNTSRLTPVDRSRAEAFAAVLLDVVEPAPDCAVPVDRLTRALNKAVRNDWSDFQTFPISSVRRLAMAIGFRVRVIDDESNVRGIALKGASRDGG